MADLKQQFYSGTQNPTIIDTHATYAFEEAQRTSVGRTYGEMTLGLIVTALTAMFTQTGNFFISFMVATRVVAQIILSFVAPGAGTLRLVAAIGIIIFAGLTAYDAQKTRALLNNYADQPEMVKKLSIFCAFQLCLDFINMFIYLLQLLGDNRD